MAEPAPLARQGSTRASSGRVSAPRNPLALGLLRPRRAAAAVLCCLLAASWLGVTTVQMYLRKAGGVVGSGGGGRWGGGWGLYSGKASKINGWLCIAVCSKQETSLKGKEGTVCVFIL